MTENPTYSHGHHESVLRSHSSRTAQNSAAYLLPYLKPNMRILDVGCGPGTITVSFAQLVPEGHVTGIDKVPADSEVFARARAHATAQGVSNVTFAPGDACDLEGIPDGSYDVVHCHQVLQHLPGDGAVRALRAMHRVAKKGGLVAVREADSGTSVRWPESAGMTAWRSAYLAMTRANGTQPEAGRRLVAWALEAGFKRGQIEATAGAVCISEAGERAWWGEMWAERTVSSTFAGHAIEKGIAGRKELEEFAASWREWSTKEDGWFALLQSQIVCRVE